MKSIFVSSTFKDMQFERDLLHARVEPSLNAKLEDEGEAVYFGDLRWGVNTSELSGLESSQKVLDVCLDEIDGCKPFMIVFIGERYGWIPEGNLLANVASTKGMQARSGMSVTHLEIEYGALLRPDLKGRAFFYFRNLDTSNMPASVLKDYASESPANKAKLIALKQDISKAFPNQVREYDAKWDPQTNSVVGLETLADRIEKDLLNAFAADEGNLRGASWQQKVLRRAEEYFLEEPPLEDYESVFDVVSKGEESVCNIIQAQSGKGKTIYLRSHYAAAKRLHGQDRYFAAFVHGLDSYSMKAKSAFLVLQYRLETILGTEHSLTDDISEQSLFALIRQAAGLLSNPLHFYIDNADEKLILALHRFFGDFSESTYLQERQCGPKWKERLVFHVAYRSDQQNMYVSPNYFGTNIIAINGIAKGKEEVFLRYLAKQKHKELSPKVINEILKKEEANDPLYLRLMVDRLMMLDGSDFAVIRSMGDGMGAIDEYMVKVVKDAGDDVDSLTKAILNEAFRKVGGRFVRDLVSLLFWTGDYVPEKEIAKEVSQYTPTDYALAVKLLGCLISKRPSDRAIGLLNLDVQLAFYDLEKDADTLEAMLVMMFELKAEASYDSFFFEHAPKAYFAQPADLIAQAIMDTYQAGMSSSENGAEIKTKRALQRCYEFFFNRRSLETRISIIEKLLNKYPKVDHSYLLDSFSVNFINQKMRRALIKYLDGILDMCIPKNLKGRSKLELQNRGLFFAAAFNKAMDLQYGMGPNASSKYCKSLNSLPPEIVDAIPTYALKSCLLRIVRNRLEDSYIPDYDSKSDYYLNLCTDNEQYSSEEDKAAQTALRIMSGLAIGIGVLEGKFGVSDKANGVNIVMNAFDDLAKVSYRGKGFVEYLPMDTVVWIIKESMAALSRHSFDFGATLSVFHSCASLVQLCGAEYGIKALCALNYLAEGTMYTMIGRVPVLDVGALSIIDDHAKWLAFSNRGTICLKIEQFHILGMLAEETAKLPPTYLDFSKDELSVRMKEFDYLVPQIFEEDENGDAFYRIFIPLLRFFDLLGKGVVSGDASDLYCDLFLRAKQGKTNFKYLATFFLFTLAYALNDSFVLMRLNCDDRASAQLSAKAYYSASKEKPEFQDYLKYYKKEIDVALDYIGGE